MPKREKRGADRGTRQLDFSEAYLDRLDDARDARLARTKKMLAKRRGISDDEDKKSALRRYAERQTMVNAVRDKAMNVPLPLSNPSIGRKTEKQKAKLAKQLAEMEAAGEFIDSNPGVPAYNSPKYRSRRPAGISTVKQEEVVAELGAIHDNVQKRMEQARPIARAMGTDLRSMGPPRQKELLLAATEANLRRQPKSPKGGDRGRSKSVRRPVKQEAKKEGQKEPKGGPRVFDWDDDQVEMARAANDRDNAARKAYEAEQARAPVRQSPKQEKPSKEEEKHDREEQQQLAQESKERGRAAKERYANEVKGERLKKAKEFLRAAAEKEKAEIQAQTAKDRAGRAAEHAAEKAKMDGLRANIKAERAPAAKAAARPAPKNAWVKNEKTGKSPAYTRARAQKDGDVIMRDPKEETSRLQKEVQSNKAAIDRQERRERPQAMAVDKPSGIGGIKVVRMNEPDDRTSFATKGEGCLMAEGDELMYRSQTEFDRKERDWDLPDTIAPCDSESNSDSDYSNISNNSD